MSNGDWSSSSHCQLKGIADVGKLTTLLEMPIFQIKEKRKKKSGINAKGTIGFDFFSRC